MTDSPRDNAPNHNGPDSHGPDARGPDSPSQQPDDFETDPRFPTGRWRGFYKQIGAPGEMELDLAFAAGIVTGGGRDPVGYFTMAGTYDTSSGLCIITKTYPFHKVDYRGYNEGKGIFGQWTIPTIPGGLAARGGFFIWPVDGQGHGQEAHEQADAPVQVVMEAFEAELQPAPARSRR